MLALTNLLLDVNLNLMNEDYEQTRDFDNLIQLLGNKLGDQGWLLAVLSLNLPAATFDLVRVAISG